MPELPEVETVKETLKPLIVGKTIAHIDVFYDKMILPLTPEILNKHLRGKTLKGIDRLGKYLLFNFDYYTLLVHLRMEGKFFLKEQGEPVLKHEHIAINFKDGTSLRYDDVRKFGTLTLKDTATVYSTLPLSKLGFEPNDKRLTKKYLKEKLNNNRVIKASLLDQRIILGLGNIYVDEVLYCAKINPKTISNRITLKQCETLITCANRVINRAIELGGSSIRSYLNSLGITGRFQNELSVHLKEGEPCLSCDGVIIKEKIATRGTYYCPRCQKYKA
ncbi:MAG: DNA-formamidopyrimidine glycosylase [Candidatus Izemoplasmataceae bacterium]